MFRPLSRQLVHHGMYLFFFFLSWIKLYFLHHRSHLDLLDLNRFNFIRFLSDFDTLLRSVWDKCLVTVFLYYSKFAIISGLPLFLCQAEGSRSAVACTSPLRPPATSNSYTSNQVRNFNYWCWPRNTVSHRVPSPPSSQARRQVVFIMEKKLPNQTTFTACDDNPPMCAPLWTECWTNSVISLFFLSLMLTHI